MPYTKAERARSLRYKRPALMSLSYDMIIDELYTIGENCDEVQWFIDNDQETLLNALDGDEDEEYEFRMAFVDLQAKAEQLLDTILDSAVQEDFDNCTVALIGNRYETVGYDSFEEDYFSLTSYDQDLAYTESGKRLMRHTKNEMLSIIGQCLGILIAFLDLRHDYDYLKATMDILKDENTSLLKTVKEIEAAYDAASEAKFMPYSDEGRHYNLLLEHLPDRAWIE